MRKKNKLFKKGAASFYIVAFSTLILMILATSFAAVIVSEITRTSNNDLSQSAYDSAMAGVEDAKLAFYSYRNCAIHGYTESNGPADCREIMREMNNPNCDMVGNILGRIDSNDSQGVLIEENTGASGVSNMMQQAYTCVVMTDKLPDYASSTSDIDVVQPKFDTESGVNADMIDSITVNWFINNGQNLKFAKYSSSKGVVEFENSLSDIPLPPVVYLGVVQTGPSFPLSSFDKSVGNKTNRGMVYLVPQSSDTTISSNNKAYIDAWDGSNNENVVDRNALVRSNDKTALTGTDATNRPYMVRCGTDESATYMCSARIKLPKPIGDGKRSDETFTVVFGVPYTTEPVAFSLEFLCKNGERCGEETVTPEGETVVSSKAKLKGVQVQIDSTGKANDLFRRVEVRLKNENNAVISVLGPLELLNKNNAGLKKDYSVSCEKNFISSSNCE